MTILVVFGEPEKFGVKHGQCVCGNNGDQIYFAADKKYDINENQILPRICNKTMLLVIQHKSGSSNYKSQEDWLKQTNIYDPVNVGEFHHGDYLFEDIKQLFVPLGKQDTGKHEIQVTNFVKKYSNHAILEYMDNCEAWNVLYQVSKDTRHADEMIKYRDLVQPFIVEELNQLEDKELLLTIEKVAAPFC